MLISSHVVRHKSATKSVFFMKVSANIWWYLIHELFEHQTQKVGFYERITQKYSTRALVKDVSGLYFLVYSNPHNPHIRLSLLSITWVIHMFVSQYTVLHELKLQKHECIDYDSIITDHNDHMSLVIIRLLLCSF